VAAGIMVVNSHNRLHKAHLNNRRWYNYGKESSERNITVR